LTDSFYPKLLVNYVAANLSDEDLDGIRHLMYLVGKNLGVEDEFNLCSGDIQDCKQYCHDILVS